MESTLAPVALFAFNRPAHTRRVLDALAANPGATETTLYFFVDGARTPGEAAEVEQVARLGESADGFARVVVRRRESNLGLFGAITAGVTEVLERHGSVIVVEDDIVACESFLRYMNDALRKYREVPRVGSIHAYALPLQGMPAYYFLAGGDCWGWGTWGDRWRLFEPDAAALVARLFATGRVLEFCRVQGYRSLLMLAQRALGRNRSWALPWHASLFLQDRVTLNPGESFVQNIGNDGSGEHSAASAVFDTPTRSSYEGIPDLALVHDADAARAVGRYYDSTGGSGIGSVARRLALRFYAVLMAWHVARNAAPRGRTHD